MRHGTLALAVVAAAVVMTAAGCSRPSEVAIQLRKDNQQLKQQVTLLGRQRDADAQMIRSLQEQKGTLPTLPHDRLDRLFTTHDIKFGRLSGGADLDRKKPGDEGLKIYVVPVDQHGDELKAAGSFTVRVIDPARPANSQVGEWTFDTEAAAKSWFGVLNRYGYVLTMPWQTVPAGTELHVNVTFLDELTQTPFSKSLDVKVNPPRTAGTNPSTQSSTTSPSARSR